MFGLGAPELIFILLLALLIFGPKKLPQIGRTLGKGMSEFRRASTELQRAINTEIEPPERPASRPVSRPPAASVERSAVEAPAEPEAPAVITEGGEEASEETDEKSSASAAEPT